MKQKTLIMLAASDNPEDWDIVLDHVGNDRLIAPQDRFAKRIPCRVHRKSPERVEVWV